MTATQLQALRRLLGYSTAEAARWVAADAERPRGVDDRTWHRWEAGQRPIPPNIAARLLELAAWRAQALAALRAAVADAPAGVDQGAPVRLVWVDDADDWTDHGAHWRPAQTAAAQLLAELGPDRVDLVPFDARAYRAWQASQGAGGPADGPAARAAWAAQLHRAGPAVAPPSPPGMGIGRPLPTG